MKLASRSLLLATLSSFAIATAAHAQQTNQPAAATQETAPDEQTIVVTGTRRSDRTVADSPVPVDVIGSEAIANTGQTETNRILNSLVPSFNFPSPSIADGSDALRPATLRGLSPTRPWSLSTASAATFQPCLTSTARSAAVAQRWIST